MTACKDEACATKAQEEARAQRTWQETAAGSGGIFKQQHIVANWFDHRKYGSCLDNFLFIM